MDSPLCDDLRSVAAGGGAAPAQRVLDLLGPSSGGPEDVVAALRAVAGGTPDDRTDAVVAAYVQEQCGG